jgi:hypothetical protein
MNELTVILTSCNRPDLLEKTIDSFIKINTYPVKEFLLHNDGPDKFLRRHKLKYPFIQFHHSPQRIGYSRSLDLLLAKVTTDWVHTLEDDWLFYQNPGFIERSMKILQEHDDIHQVWIRDEKDFGHPLGQSIVLSGIHVKPVMPGYRKVWNGFSLNPGLRRMSDWKKFFPNGLAEYGDEAVLAERTKQFNYKAVCLVDSSIKHLGWSRRSINFKA